LNHSRWIVLPKAPDEFLSAVSGFPPLIGQLLYNRGITDANQLDSFITADESLAGDPMLLPGIHDAIRRIYQALLSGEKIVIYGDFDADGITATALMVQGLSRLGANVEPYLPHRINEGHGLRTGTLDKLREQGFSLVITVDCGITGFAEVKRAQKKGMDIIVTDHHTPLDEIPAAAAVVDPKLKGSAYPFTELAGVGVAFKFLQAVLRSLGKEEQIDELLDLVALGTVADVMPLVGENRYLVKQGLKQLNARPRLGISEMLAQAGQETGNLDAESISWIIAPRLNTTGRLEHALPSYKLLMTDSREKASEISCWLEEKNAERQRMTTRIVESAREKIMAQGISPLLMVEDEEYPAGIIGLAAGRLSEEFYRPTVVIKTGKISSTGSCRSIPEFNMIKALTGCQKLFTRFGGHPQAAGFSLPTKYIPKLKAALMERAARDLEGVDLRPCLNIDADIKLAELGGEMFSSMQKLAPFGRGNSHPTFLTRKVEVISCRTIGSDGSHLMLKMRQGGMIWDGIAFRAGDYIKEATSPLDIVYNLEVDEWRGEKKLRLNLLDFNPTGTQIPETSH